MKRTLFLAVVGSLALASCNRAKAPDVSGTTKATDFTARLNTTAGSGYTAAAGKSRYVDLTGGDRVTTLTATGLKPNTEYISHFHARGAAAAAGTSDCESAGGVVGGLIGGKSFTSDASGALTIKGVQTTADLSTATYINIHEAATSSVIPLCADIPNS